MKVKLRELNNYDDQVFRDGDKVWRVSRLIKLTENHVVENERILKCQKLR